MQTEFSGVFRKKLTAQNIVFEFQGSKAKLFLRCDVSFKETYKCFETDCHSLVFSLLNSILV